MQVILIAARKGGAGKSTLTRNLGVAAAQDGLRVLLIDLDEQQTLRKWWRRREAEIPAMFDEDPEPTALTDLLPRLDGFDLVLIDTPGQSFDWLQSIAQLADLVLLPVRPSPPDLEAIGETLGHVRRSQTDYAFVLSQARRTKLSAEAVRVIAGHGPLAPTNLAMRVSHEEADVTGHGATEYPDPRAAAEVAALWTYVKERLDA